uniref:CCHC-type domain-containing protein n=1 Tax=Sinocyclocheilus rhinocerous TaxID=307959 RepID=A0A673IN86_9TELE
MDGPVVTDTAMAGGARRRNDNGLDKGQGNDRSMVTDLEMADGNQRANDIRLRRRQRDGNESEKEARKVNGKRIYLKEATITVEIGQVKEARAMDVIKSVTERIGDGRILVVRPKQTKEYEVMLEREEDADLLTNGLTIKGINCEVKRLQNRDYVVSFMHLPVYVADKEILDKLEGWGVCPLSKIKRRVYPGTDIEDGTRFVKARFPKEVASLPYSTRMETAEGPQYFRVMHSHQIKTCRLCMSPEHVVKDCPDFKCFKCEERGHFARDCSAVRCPDCREFLNKCECWMGSEEEEEEEESQQMAGEMHRRDNEQREMETMDTQDNELIMRKDGEQHQNIKDKQTVQ